jgi:hypothetical protein
MVSEKFMTQKGKIKRIGSVWITKPFGVFDSLAAVSNVFCPKRVKKKSRRTWLSVSWQSQKVRRTAAAKRPKDTFFRS